LRTRPQQGFILTIIIQAIVVLTMVGIAFGLVEKDVDTHDPRYKTLPCYLAMFALAEVFELVMAIDALKMRNTIQLVGIIVFHIGLVVFAALQVHEAHTALVFSNADPCTSFIGCDGPGTLWRKVEPFLIVTPCIIALSWFVMLFFVRALFSEFGWAIFRVVGANPTMKAMYQWYQIMICLLKFDFFCFTGVTIQLLIIVLQKNSAEFALTIIAIPVVLVLLIGCSIALRREVKWLMTISLILMLASETYFIYKLVRFYEPASEAQYETTRATLTTFTIVAFLMLFGTFAVGLRCFSDFDKGLLAPKNHTVVDEKPIFGGSVPSSPGINGNERQTSYTGGPVLGRRLSIE